MTESFPTISGKVESCVHRDKNFPYTYTNKHFEQKAQKLRVALIGRGYKDKDILPHINKASTFTQSQLLTSHSTTNTSRTLPFVIPYHPDLTPLPHILKRHWNILKTILF